MEFKSKKRVSLALLLLSMMAVAESRADDDSSASLVPKWFAKIDGEIITVDEFAATMRTAARNKFYHGAPPQVAIEELKKEVSERLIVEHLVVGEARRLGLVPDKNAVAKVVSEFESKNQSNSNWQSLRAEWLPVLIKRTEEDDISRQLERNVRKITATDADLKLFYENNHALFTTPAKNHVKIIMLKLDPAATVDERERAEHRIKSIEEQLKAGAKFDQLARRHSSDDSAARGGDLGVLHQGQLSAQAEAALEKLTPGGFSSPLQLLDGWAIVKLVEREPALLNPFDRVKERAFALYEREQAEKQWSDFVKRLRANVVVEINPEL